MFTQDSNDIPRNPKEINFEACVKFVERTWPEDDEETKLIRAESIYVLAKSFFNDILPSEVKKVLAPSLN